MSMISTKRVYTSESPLRRPLTLFRQMRYDLLDSRELAWQLAARDIKALYRQSLLGIAWAFILPLANAVTWLFLKGSGVVMIRDTNMPYSVYVFSGTMLWAIFMESLLSPLQKTTENKSMLTKINFPREALLLSGLYQSLFNAGIKFLLILIGVGVLGSLSSGWSLLLFPLAIFALVLVGTAIGLLLTPIGLLYTDIGKGLPVVLQFLMYLTPVVFPRPVSGLLGYIVKYNPVTPLIMNARDWLTGNPAIYTNSFIAVVVSAILLLFFVWLLYRVAIPILIERMSA